jgi:hypothetical protein
MSDQFSSKELQYLGDTDFLLTKRTILEKAFSGFKTCSELIDIELLKSSYKIDSKYLLPASKISRGDNYRGLPYMVLDNPRYFKKGSVLSYRILLWWGNFISFSLHLEGDICAAALTSILSKYQERIHNQTYYCLGLTPWEHHFEESNYQLLVKITPDQVNEHYKEYGFIRITKKATLKEWPFLNDLAIRNLQLLSDLASLGQQS